MLSGTEEFTLDKNVTFKDFEIEGRKIRMRTEFSLGHYKSYVETEDHSYTIDHGCGSPASKNPVSDNGNRWVNIINEEVPMFGAGRSRMIAFCHGDEECIKAIIRYEAEEVAANG